MGLIDSIRNLLGLKRFKAIQSDLASLQSDLNRFESLSIEPQSLELGVAAGYTSHFIKEIEAGLKRIESQMLTKDWFSIKLDESVSKRLDLLQKSLDDLLLQVQGVPEPHRTLLTNKIRKIQSNIPLSPKMSELVSVVKAAGEISYEDLAQRLSITIPALRGLLAETLKRTDLIERFRKGNKGWVRHTSTSSSDSQALQSDLTQQGEQIDKLRQSFEEAVSKLGFKIEQRYYNESPNFVLSRENNKVAVEIKPKSDSSTLEKALGQLLYAKETLSPTELWLVVPSKPSEDWLKIFEANGIKVFCLSQQGLSEVKPGSVA